MLERRYHLIHLAVCNSFPDLNDLMKRFHVQRCVIDALPETHATRDFADEHRGRVFMCFFSPTPKGVPSWDHRARTVHVNRTDALDASRAAIRQKKVTLPRRLPLLELFARHMAADAKVLEEDEATGRMQFKYPRPRGENHFSFAFTYAWLAALRLNGPRAWINWARQLAEQEKKRR